MTPRSQPARVLEWVHSPPRAFNWGTSAARAGDTMPRKSCPQTDGCLGQRPPPACPAPPPAGSVLEPRPSGQRRASRAAQAQLGTWGTPAITPVLLQRFPRLERAMLSRRRVFAVERLGGRDGAFEDLAQGCVVPGVTCTYRRIPDKTHGCSLDFREGQNELRGLERQMPLLKLASQDSGMEMVVGDSSLATLSGLSQDSLNLEPMGSPELPPAQLDRLLARQKLEQVLERSREFPSLSGRRGPLQLLNTPVGGVPVFVGEQESTEVDTELEAGLEEAKQVGNMESGACTCLPGQGLRYLEHLCLVLEQMARLQQLYLQLQSQRPSREPEEEELALALSSSHIPDNKVQGHREELSQTKDPEGAEAASFPEVGVIVASPSGLPEALLEPTHILPPSQGHKQDLSHWDKVKVLLNRIRWRSPRLPEPPVPPDSSRPRMEFRTLSERTPCHSQRKTFIPTLVVKKPRVKNLSV